MTISSLNATITGMHLNSSWNGATIDHLSATAFVSLSSLTDGISSELGGRRVAHGGARRRRTS